MYSICILSNVLTSVQVEDLRGIFRWILTCRSLSGQLDFLRSVYKVCWLPEKPFPPEEEDKGRWREQWREAGRGGEEWSFYLWQHPHSPPPLPFSLTLSIVRFLSFPFSLTQDAQTVRPMFQIHHFNCYPDRQSRAHSLVILGKLYMEFIEYPFVSQSTEK